MELFRKLSALVERHLSLVTLQVALVSHHNQWYLIGTLEESRELEISYIERTGHGNTGGYYQVVQNLISNNSHHLKGLA